MDLEEDLSPVCSIMSGPDDRSWRRTHRHGRWPGASAIFDHVIVDEAAVSTRAEVLYALGLGSEGAILTGSTPSSGGLVGETGTIEPLDEAGLALVILA